MRKTKFRVAIIGSGNIGTDILIKLLRSEILCCVLFIGRNPASQGISIAKSFGIKTGTNGDDDLLRYANEYDLVFDATSASSHQKHAAILKKLNKRVIDLTPAKLGKLCVPTLNMDAVLEEDNINMVTCGGQASIPIVHALSQVHRKIEYIEVVSSIAAKSAGPATRYNIDEYLETTESAIKQFSGCKHAKAMLNINPAIPSVDMKTSIYAKIDNPKMRDIQYHIDKVVKEVKTYVPGYQLLIEPWFDGAHVMTMLRVTGQGDYLPAYAGNLDIVTCAAVKAAESMAKFVLSHIHNKAA